MSAAPQERITRDDLERRFREVQTSVDEQRASALESAIAIGAVVAVGVVAVAFLLGRRKGRKRTTVVEVRRI